MTKYQLPAMRRKDRAIDNDAIVSFLKAASHGFLATMHNGQPVQTINTFVYDEKTHSIYLHTAKQGFTRTIIESNERVSFAVAEMGRLLPAKVAKELSVEFESAIITGRGSIVDDVQIAREKMQMLIDKYFPHLVSGKDYRPTTPKELDEITVFQVAIDSWSGKFKKEDKEFEGAFDFESKRCPF